MTDYHILFNNFPVIQTERLVLRAYRKDDVLRHNEIWKDQEIMREFYDENSCMAIENSVDNITNIYPQRFFDKTQVTWAVTLKLSGEIIGHRELYLDGPNSPAITQGFIVKSFRNLGYNQEIL